MGEQTEWQQKRTSFRWPLESLSEPSSAEGCQLRMRVRQLKLSNLLKRPFIRHVNELFSFVFLLRWAGDILCMDDFGRKPVLKRLLRMRPNVRTLSGPNNRCGQIEKSSVITWASSTRRSIWWNLPISSSPQCGPNGGTGHHTLFGVYNHGPCQKEFFGMNNWIMASFRGVLVLCIDTHTHARIPSSHFAYNWNFCVKPPRQTTNWK